jgi:hypothetical protein
VRDTPLVKAVALALTIDITDDGDVLGPTCLRYAFLSPSTCWPMAPLSEIALTPRKS